MKFPSLDESRSRHLQNSSVSMSLGLDKFSDISLEPNLLVSSFIVSTTFVLVSMFLWSRSRSRLWDSDHFSLGLGLVIETQTFLVSVSVSSLRLRPFQSRSRSRHWDSDIFSLGLGLVIETQTFSVSVSSLRLKNVQSRSRSRWSKSGLVDPWFRCQMGSSLIPSVNSVSIYLSLFKVKSIF